MNEKIMLIENMLRKSEFYFWFLIPSAIAIFVLVKSIKILIQNRNWKNWTMTPIIALIVILSEYILSVIFFMDAYPTYLPHIGIGLASFIYGFQAYLNNDTDR